MIPAIALFAVTYILILAFGKYRTYIALASGVIFVLTGMLPVSEVLSSIDFNVLLMIIGTMGLVSLFTESKMLALLADMVMEKVPNVKWAAVSLALFAGIISAFVDNVATMIPVVAGVAAALNITPHLFISDFSRVRPLAATVRPSVLPQTLRVSVFLRNPATP